MLLTRHFKKFIFYIYQNQGYTNFWSPVLGTACFLSSKIFACSSKKQKMLKQKKEQVVSLHITNISNMYQYLKTNEAVVIYSGAIETRERFKNGAKPKSLMRKRQPASHLVKFLTELH